MKIYVNFWEFEVFGIYLTKYTHIIFIPWKRFENFNVLLLATPLFTSVFGSGEYHIFIPCCSKAAWSLCWLRTSHKNAEHFKINILTTFGHCYTFQCVNLKNKSNTCWKINWFRPIDNVVLNGNSYIDKVIGENKVHKAVYHWITFLNFLICILSDVGQYYLIRLD